MTRSADVTFWDHFAFGNAFSASRIARPNRDELRNPGVVAVARRALLTALEHGDRAKPRTITVFARGTEHRFGGRSIAVSVQQFAELARAAASGVGTKADCPYWAPGLSSSGRRQEQDCANVGWLALDCDETGDWHLLVAVLRAHNTAFVAYRSPSHTAGAPRWRTLLPLRHEWVPGPDLELARRRYKQIVYPAARTVFGALAGLDAPGFDPATDQLLNRFYFPHRRTMTDPPPAVVSADGVSLDINALIGPLEAKGCLPTPRPPNRRRDRAQREGIHPFVKAHYDAGWVHRAISDEKLAVQCPWQAEHTTGGAGDTSTVLWLDGGWFCSHAHCRERGALDVVDALPEQVRAQYWQAIATGGGSRAVLKAAPRRVFHIG